MVTMNVLHSALSTFPADAPFSNESFEAMVYSEIYRRPVRKCLSTRFFLCTLTRLARFKFGTQRCDGKTTLWRHVWFVVQRDFTKYCDNNGNQKVTIIEQQIRSRSSWQLLLLLLEREFSYLVRRLKLQSCQWHSGNLGLILKLHTVTTTCSKNFIILQNDVFTDGYDVTCHVNDHWDHSIDHIHGTHRHPNAGNDDDGSTSRGATIDNDHAGETHQEAFEFGHHVTKFTSYGLCRTG